MSSQIRVPTTPVSIRFSLWHQNITADNYDRYISRVMDPIQQLLCENRFYLVASSLGGDLCITPQRHDYNPKNDSYGDGISSVLMQAPVLVTDRNDNNSNIKWTEWRVLCWILQVGQNFVEMAKLSDDPDGEISVMDHVIQLSIDVSIEEGHLDQGLQLAGLLNAHASVVGEEVNTFSPFALLPTQNNNSSSSSSLLENNSFQPHSIRILGGIILVVSITLHVMLIIIARYRRKHQIQMEAQRSPDDELSQAPLTSDTGVDKMLERGRGASVELIQNSPQFLTRRSNVTPESNNNDVVPNITSL